MENLSDLEKALIYFALTYLIEQFNEDLLVRFLLTHITDELSDMVGNLSNLSVVILLINIFLL